MPMHSVRKVSLLLAGFIASVTLLSGGVVLAGVLIPKSKPVMMKSSQKPAWVKTVKGIPYPARKPAVKVTDKKVGKKSTHNLKLARQALKGKPIKVALAADSSSSAKTGASFFSMFSKKSAKGVFSDKQMNLYREIFVLQEKGDFKQADQKIKRLDSSLLLGHVQAQRYLHPVSYRASYQELQKWMGNYADHPAASRIYKLALSRQPSKGKGALNKPILKKKIGGNLENKAKQKKNYKSLKQRTASQEQRVRKLTKDVHRHISRKDLALALNILSADYAVQFMDDVEYDRLRARIAGGYLFSGKFDQAATLSQEALKRSQGAAPFAAWVNGLANWQKQKYTKAVRGFEVAATSPYSSGWMVSASSYWASRAHVRSGNKKQVGKWLALSATYPRTFYGLIAARALGRKSGFDWSVPSLTGDHVDFIEGTIAGKRAAALIQVGRMDMAESELRNIHPGKSKEAREALLAYANYYQLPALSMHLGNAFTNPKGGLYNAALYPVVPWTPTGGYRVDQALIHAIARQESRFKVSAQNPSGATGLMQLMPRTANYIAKTDIYQKARGQHQLKNPVLNLDIGQMYIEELLNHKAVGQDLLSLAMAYNAGPGNLSRWKRERVNMDDPLLFIETIPFTETRAFVERVMSNYWIYRMRLKQKTPSLDAVAKGKWARYAAQDSGNVKMASR